MIVHQIEESISYPVYAHFNFTEIQSAIDLYKAWKKLTFNLRSVLNATWKFDSMTVTQRQCYRNIGVFKMRNKLNEWIFLNLFEKKKIKNIYLLSFFGSWLVAWTVMADEKEVKELVTYRRKLT